jgi:PTS system sucrose-specific IIC component
MAGASEAKIKRMAREIYENVGGINNVETLIHCMTRVRMTIRDMNLVNMNGLKQIDGVMGVVNDDTLQVIVGPGTVNKVADEMVQTVGVKLGEPFPTVTVDTTGMTDREIVEAKAAQVKAAQKAKQKQTPIKRILKSISNIFIPLIPVFVGAGLIGGIAAVLSNLLVAGDIGKNWSDIILVLNIIKNGVFAYLSIYVGINSATEFGATPGLGGVIGSVTLLTGMAPEMPLHNIFNGQPMNAGQGGIIGVIFAVWVLSLIEKRLHKWIPDSIDIIVTPTISLLLIGIFTIFLVMPVAGVISSSLVGAINWILNVGGAFSGFALGALFLPMVMFGLHQILTPIHIEMINKTGATPLLPILAMAGAGQVGAAFALWIKCRKNKQLTNMIKGALPVGILGIGEPLIYGVTLPLGRPFITACIGGGIGGAVVGGLGHVGAIAIGPSGVALIPLITNHHIFAYVLGLLAGYVGGFVATFFFGVPKDAIVGEDEVQNEVNSEVQSEVQKTDVIKADITNATITSPVVGSTVDIKKVSDPMMAQEVMGLTMAVVPNDDSKIYAPVDGKVSMIADTKHAIGFIDEIGEEVLVHMGVDTVKLNGKGFEIEAEVGAEVHQGEVLGTVDWQMIRNEGLDSVTMTIVTNASDYQIQKAPVDTSVSSDSVLMKSEVQ